MTSFAPPASKPYDPATALLTAYPSLGNEWKSKGAQSLLVKPVNTPELLRQLEALLITHQDHEDARSRRQRGKGCDRRNREGRAARGGQAQRNKLGS